MTWTVLYDRQLLCRCQNKILLHHPGGLQGNKYSAVRASAQNFTPMTHINHRYHSLSVHWSHPRRQRTSCDAASLPRLTRLSPWSRSEFVFPSRVSADPPTPALHPSAASDKQWKIIRSRYPPQIGLPMARSLNDQGWQSLNAIFNQFSFSVCSVRVYRV